MSTFMRGRECVGEGEREMKHGKTHRREVEQSVPEWREKFLAYKKLKKEVKMINPRLMKAKKCHKRVRLSTKDVKEREVGIRSEDIGFIQLLEDEHAKVKKFFMEKEETYVIIFKEMKDKVANLECYKEIQEVQRDILKFHGEMILLLHYCVLNFTGLMKIVKKHNKKAGSSTYSPFISRVLQQPFYSTELLYRLMNECQAMLKLQQSLVLKQLAM